MYSRHSHRMKGLGARVPPGEKIQARRNKVRSEWALALGEKRRVLREARGPWKKEGCGHKTGSYGDF